jgi:phosphoglycolate phosphatase
MASYLEVVRQDYLRGPFRAVVFDFDGTLSLLRGNWQGLMAPMCVEALLATGTGETRDELTQIVEEFITRLTGQPTMQQMLALCDEVDKRGRPRPDPNVYFNRYMDTLLRRTKERIEAVMSGQETADEMLIAGARPLLEALSSRDLLLVIASGTELGDVCRESQVLKIDHYFNECVFGPVNNDPQFSKERVLRHLMEEHALRGEEIAAIGDGPAEMLAINAVGGLAIGVASDELHHDGRVNQLKRAHLLRAGADLIVADYRNVDMVLSLFGQ